MPEDSLKQFQHLMRGILGEGVYLGNIALKRGAKAPVRPTTDTSNKKSETRLSSPGEASEASLKDLPVPAIYKYNMVNIGVPFLRVV